MTEETREKKYLNDLMQKINLKLVEIDEAIQLKKEEIDAMHLHMQEHKRDMDHLDKNAIRESISNYAAVGEHALDARKRLRRLKEIAYFGRVDFCELEKGETKEVYVGVHNFQDPEQNKNLVYDWRAPISSLFYDYELGEAQYQTDKATFHGNISLKRQFRIRNAKMEYMLDTDVTILDEVLQKELNQASSDKMKNIVATIQKEQNAIIRNEESRHLIIQGVAGSGKTSIALHRIAYLLYRFKENVSAEDILIISPNKVFSNYISNVLPELGEEAVAETSMEEIANELLDYQVNFQTFFEQVSELLNKPDSQFIERIQFKSSAEILKKLDQYLVYLENEGFDVTDIFIKKKPVPAWFIRETFAKYHRFPILKRFNEVVAEIVRNMHQHYKIEIQYKDRTEVHTMIRKMFPSYNPRVLYKGFYDWLGRPEMLKMSKGNAYEWSDVYPLLYLKMKLEGLKPRTKVKHLVIDEMQDYSAVQYRVLSNLFTCRKTILGDINQSVNPFSASDLNGIEFVFAGATTMTLSKSYRSTYQITQFSKRIRPGVVVEPIERHGSEPEVIPCRNIQEEMETIKRLLKDFELSNFNSLGIITKTQKYAEEIYEALKFHHKLRLLDSASASFGGGIVITTAHLAKGLEFDYVIIPACTERYYHTEPDRQMLYVACTRAMHRLFFTFTGQKSSFIV